MGLRDFSDVAILKVGEWLGLPKLNKTDGHVGIPTKPCSKSARYGR